MTIEAQALRAVGSDQSSVCPLTAITLLRVLDTIELSNKLNPPSSVHSFSKYLLASYSVLGTVLGAWGT